jgi:hypothetical protein
MYGEDAATLDNLTIIGKHRSISTILQSRKIKIKLELVGLMEVQCL